MNRKKVLIASFIGLIFCSLVHAQNKTAAPKLVSVASGWASNSVNAVIFRKNSLVTFRDTQFVAFYDADRFVVLGKRKLGSVNWQIQKTQYQGNAADAHNTIALMVDGDGFLHLSWDHHGNPLRYCSSVAPGSLILGDKRSMTGIKENQVTYPEFYKLPDGNLLFFYRDGKSGQGDLIINKYETRTQKWTQLSDNLISGEGKRNPYTQACVDAKGTIHISWVWRESPDVASNHDLAYARSTDGGKTWEKSTGEKYQLPITISSAEYAVKIPQKSELINQTSMTADAAGNPFIATYWRDSATTVPQYHVIYTDKNSWKVQNLGFRKTGFSLSGGGTKSIPVSRPQILVASAKNKTAAVLIFRDEERGSRVSVAVAADISKNKWKIKDLTTTSVGSWEPSYDTELWQKSSILNLFVEKVEQVDGEGKANLAPQMVQVLEWKPNFK
ncbi:MAG: neuraminidase [Sphingobacteriaceae bacterium]|nr:MAG: neuraminidase [Sphingobacteriaceae bacterium]